MQEPLITINNVLASVPVKDLTAAEAWYTKVLGRPADAKPMPELAEWKFSGGGWLQVYEGPDRAGGGSFTLAVDDIAQVIRDLKAAGIQTGTQTQSKTAQTVMVKDPDGNSLAFALAQRADVAR